MKSYCSKLLGGISMFWEPGQISVPVPFLKIITGSQISRGFKNWYEEIGALNQLKNYFRIGEMISGLRDFFEIETGNILFPVSFYALCSTYDHHT